MGIMGYETCFTSKDCFKVKHGLVLLTKNVKVIQLTMANMRTLLDSAWK